MDTQLRSVLPAQIQSELNKIWESLETKNTTRASLFNLIFFTSRDHRTAYFQKVAQKVVEKFPSRVLFVIADHSATDSFLKTEISILKASKGDYDVACDYIQIETGKEANEKIPFLILPHILPDLPVYLVYAQDPCASNTLCTQLEKFANRLIFDSEITQDLSCFAANLLEHHRHGLSDIADLNWARMEDWRDLFSMIFYTEEKLAVIRRTKKLHITYNKAATSFFCRTQIQAIYLQAWLACQLGWTFEGSDAQGERLSLRYKNGNEPLLIQLEPESVTQLPPGLILSLKVETELKETFLFQRDRNQLHHVEMQYSDASSCALPCHYMLPKAESGHSLVKEICHRGTSKHYLNVLNLIQHMHQMGSCK